MQVVIGRQKGIIWRVALKKFFLAHHLSRILLSSVLVLLCKCITYSHIHTLLMLKLRCSATQSLASSNSSLKFITYIVSRESIKVNPKPNQFWAPGKKEENKISSHITCINLNIITPLEIGLKWSWPQA